MKRPLRIPSPLKTAIADLLCSSFIGNLLSRAYSDRIPNGGLVVDTSHPSVTPQLTASIFWRIYEGAEIRFVHQFLRPDLDVIELGSSIGVLSCHIKQRLLPSCKLI